MRALIIGFGSIARNAHYPVLHRMGAQIDVVDTVAPPSDYDVKYLGAQIPTLGDYDVALIASPPALHCEHAVKAANVARKILCEKPPATSVSELNDMLSAARRNNTSFMFGFHLIRMDAWKRFKEVMSPILDEFWCKYDIDFYFHWVHRNGIPPARWFREKQMGGGVTLDLVSQLVALFYDLVGKRELLPLIAGGIREHLLYEDGDADYDVGYWLDEPPSAHGVRHRFTFDATWVSKIPTCAVIDNCIDPPVIAGFARECTHRSDELLMVHIVLMRASPTSYEFIRYGDNAFAICESTNLNTPNFKRRALEYPHNNTNPYEVEWNELLSAPQGFIDELGVKVQSVLDDMRARSRVLIPRML
ncbi:MAG: Gfo/Idh/MocA family oxidoreductase [Ignisphaera sp.]